MYFGRLADHLIGLGHMKGGLVLVDNFVGSGVREMTQVVGSRIVVEPATGRAVKHCSESPLNAVVEAYDSDPDSIAVVVVVIVDLDSTVGVGVGAGAGVAVAVAVAVAVVVDLVVEIPEVAAVVERDEVG